ncbi:MAG: crossover junction endodeoxyribonuclease RuvC [Candidatus Paceibacterota bacterium]|jgi:crossover junction endodeoxyribonuclease RuvC
MKILGIDPGYGRLGLAVIEKPNKGKEVVLYSSCMETFGKDSIYQRFKEIGLEIVKIIEEYKPDEVALETLFIEKNQKTGMRVAEVRGIIIYEAVKRDIPVFEYSPLQIKSSITGDGTSDKTRMIKMIGLLVKLPKKIKLDDEYDAIAVALTHSACRRSLLSPTTNH